MLETDIVCFFSCPTVPVVSVFSCPDGPVIHIFKPLTLTFRFQLLHSPYCFVFQYAKLAITLTVPGGGKKKKAAAAPGDGGMNSRADKPEEEEDEYAGGLC